MPEQTAVTVTIRVRGEQTVNPNSHRGYGTYTFRTFGWCFTALPRCRWRDSRLFLAIGTCAEAYTRELSIPHGTVAAAWFEYELSTDCELTEVVT